MNSQILLKQKPQGKDMLTFEEILDLMYGR